MNVTFRLATEDLEKKFVKESTAAGFDGLKGHRSVGGMRASIYNAFPEDGVDTLVEFMREFERRIGHAEQDPRVRSLVHRLNFAPCRHRGRCGPGIRASRPLRCGTSGHRSALG